MFSITLAPMSDTFASNTYLVCSNNEYAVIDPSVPYSSSLLQGKVKYILLTHAHFDHILYIDAWVEATGAEVIVSKYDKPALSDAYRNAYFFVYERRAGVLRQFGCCR